MRIRGRMVLAAGVLLCWGGLVRMAGEYPVSLDLSATATTATASVTSTVVISVERLMEESRRVRATDALKHGGYPGFFNLIRTLPPVGTIGIGIGANQVEVRYAQEAALPDGRRRLVLVADRPLFFLGGGDPAKSRAGYELTIVDLTFEKDGKVSGAMAGAARVKPSAEGVPVLDDYADVRVRLTGSVRRP